MQQLILSSYIKLMDMVISSNLQLNPTYQIYQWQALQLIIKFKTDTLLIQCKYKFIPKLMQNSDLSEHSLNNSTSKQKYSFSRDKRFHQRDHKPVCEEFYDLPTTKAQRTTTQGYGHKVLEVGDHSFIPGVGTYQLRQKLNDPTQRIRMKSFGTCRQKMEITGPFGDIKYLQKLPPPCAYDPNPRRDLRAPFFNSRLADHYLEKVAKLPGPGTYNYEAIGTPTYYITSRHRNFTNGRFSQLERSQPLSHRKRELGPGEYADVDNINKVGRYSLAKHISASSCVFSKSPRQGLVQKAKLFVPGPGQYKSFSSFG